MEDRIHVIVLTAEGKKLDKMVSYVSVPGEDGPVGILAGHLPLICSVKSGELKCRFGDEQELSLRLWDGIASVADNEVSVLASRAEEV